MIVEFIITLVHIRHKFILACEYVTFLKEVYLN